MQSVANSGFRYGVRTLHLIKLHGSQQLYDLHDMYRFVLQSIAHLHVSCDILTPYPTMSKERSNKNKENLNEEFHEHEELRTEVMK